MHKPESKLRTRIKLALEKKVGGLWIVIHTGPFQEMGVHDLLGCVQGIFFSLEVKRPGKEGEYTAVQRYFEYRVVKNGGYSAMVTTPHEAVDFVRRKVKHHAKH